MRRARRRASGARRLRPGTRPAAEQGAAEQARIVRRLREIRRLARRLRREATAPAVERVCQIIETECHLALWALGDVRGMIPEAEPRA